MFHFKAELSDGIHLKETVYIKEEKSFMETNESDISLMIGHQYMSLELSLSSGCLTGLSGFMDLSLCRQEEIEQIQADTGIVSVISDLEKLKSGMGYESIIPGLAIYDAHSRLLQIGQPNEKSPILLSPNVSVFLTESDITCIQIKVVCEG